jgi:hypothetical protein
MIRPLIIVLALTVTLGCYGQKIENTPISDLLTPLTPGFNEDVNISFNKEAKFIMSGEIHGVPSNMMLKYQFLIHAYKNNNVRYLVMEAGPAMAYAVNEYLSTGDESLLKFSTYCFMELEFWRALKAFNEQVNPADKIEVIGFDFDWIEPYRYVVKDILTPKPEYKENTNQTIKSIINELDNKATNESIPRLNSKIKELLNSEDSIFNNDISSNKVTLDLIAWNQVPATAQITRDKETYKNIVRGSESFNKGNFFAQYGVSHVNKTRACLTTLLHKSSDSPFYGKVVSISRNYTNCESKLGDKTDYLDNWGILRSLGIKFSDLDKTPTDISYFKTEELKIRNKDLQLAVDYIIIIQNQKW